MSNTIPTNLKISKRLPRVTERIANSEDGESYQDNAEEAYEDYEDIYEDEEVVQPVGLFSTPARAITLGFSILLLFLVVGTLAWFLGQSGKQGTNGANNNEQAYKATSAGGLQPIPDITNTKASYTSKPDGVSEAPRVGSLPPNFQWTDQKTGQPVTLESLRGKPVLLNFWGTWCPPCRAEMPEMQKIYDREKDNLTFLGLSMGPRDEPLGVAQFVQLNDYTWDFIHDPNSDVMLRYQVTGIPSSYFIDKNGVIRAIHVGGADAQILEDNLKKAQQ